MAKVTIPLKHGIEIGETLHREVVVRDANVGDILDATIESERVVPTPSGWVLLASPAMVGLHQLRRQIDRIGDYEGVVTLEMMRRLQTEDLEALQAAAEQLDRATLEATEMRGRDDPIPEPD